MKDRICRNCQHWAEKPNRFDGMDIGDGLNIRAGRCLAQLRPVDWVPGKELWKAPVTAEHETCENFKPLEV